MTAILDKYLKKSKFNSYEEFVKDFKIEIPKSFNFAYDVVDEIAKRSPGKTAMVWCDEQRNEAKFTFAQMKEYSDKAANFFSSVGITKGDPVMLVLKRRYEFWFACLGLHKIGAAVIPATHLLTVKDIIYRNNSAGIKMIVSVADQEIINRVNEAQASSPTLKLKASLGEFSGWLNFNREIGKADSNFERPSGKLANKNSDIFLLYFTSGTTAVPKMVRHDFTYPLGHIVTAKYWQNVQDSGLHFTVADTGWAKSAWGKIYGQWLSECAIFVYDYNRFVPKDMLNVLSKYGVTSFCAPPTIFRYLIKEDLSKYDFSKLKYCAVAGEPLNPEVYSQFLEKTGIKLMEGYGQTETIVLVATYPWLEPKPGSMGKPSPGYDVDVVDEKFKSC